MVSLLSDFCLTVILQLYTRMSLLHWIISSNDYRIYIADHSLPSFNDPSYICCDIFNILLSYDSFGHSFAIIVILLCGLVSISDILDPCMDH